MSDMNWNPQKTAKPHVCIVGIGALGSHLVQFLRHIPAVHTLIDFDRVETKNTLSQFHSVKHVGKLKVEAIAQTMGFIWGSAPGITTISRHSKLVQNNASELLGTSPSDTYRPLVIDCLDNGDGRRVLQEHVRKYGIPCLHGGLAADGAFGRVVWDKDFVIDDEDGAGAATCEDGRHLPFIGVVSAYLAMAASRYLETGKQYGYSISPTNVIVI